MGRKAYTPEQVINKLREVEVHISQGATTAVAGNTGYENRLGQASQATRD